MDQEIDASAAFIARYLDARKVPAEKRIAFQGELAAAMRRHLAGHFDPSNPLKGNGYRSVAFHNGTVPTLVLEAAQRAQVLDLVSPTELGAFFPTELVVWTDPMSSSYRSGASGQIVPIYTHPSAPASILTPPRQGRSTPTVSTPRIDPGLGMQQEQQAYDSPRPPFGFDGPRAFGSPDSFASTGTTNSYANMTMQAPGDYLDMQMNTWS